MKFHVRFRASIDWKKLQKLLKNELERLQNAIQKKIAVDPYTFGKPLRKSYKGCRTLRVGDFRVIYRVNKQYIDILVIAHRSRVYEN